MERTVLDDLRRRALELGFAHVGACAPRPAERDADAYQAWIDAGMHGEMAYMARADRMARALDPGLSLPDARAIVVVGASYRGGTPDHGLMKDPARGLIASYARGTDYHDVLIPRLDELADWLSARLGRPVARQTMVDFRPLLERDAARRAGLGFIGRNTMLIHPRAGSWTFLGALLVDVDPGLSNALTSSVGGATPLRATAAPRAARDPDALGPCGRCTRCLDACPTNAFTRPYVLDARRCISYLTIELKGTIPRELRASLGNWVFGCDVCNDVCPYNLRFGGESGAATFVPREDMVAPALVELLALDEAAYRVRFQGTPLMRPGRRGLLRNVCVAAGNWGDRTALSALSQALADREPLVRGHAAWAIGQLRAAGASRVLDAARAVESDPWVGEEIAHALTSHTP